MRLSTAWRRPLADGRLLLASPFPDTQRRPTARLAAERNAFVAALATRVFVAHAAPAGKTELFCRHLRALGKTLLTLDDPHTANLLALGAHPLRPTDLRPLL